MRRRWDRVAPWVAPAVLCAVALLQLGFSRSGALSPWKGGGFGMFATVDSPGARFLRIYLLTPQQEIPVLVPDDLRAASLELRTTAWPGVAGELAGSIAAGTWVRLRLTSAVDYYRYLLRQRYTPSPDQEVGAELLLLGDSLENTLDFDSLDFVRMLGPVEAPGPDDAVLEVRSVRVELWRYRFDRESLSLRAEKLFEVTS